MRVIQEAYKYKTKMNADHRLNVPINFEAGYTRLGFALAEISRKFFAFRQPHIP